MTLVSYAELIDVQARASEKIDTLVKSLLALEKALKFISDQDLEAVFLSGGSSDPAADRADFRTWQATMRGYADNYSGGGELTDKSLEIQKRVRPTI